ncbi:MAG: 1-(5-phosphoribosyl)-5-amino-4-imidazole-carboxylate carboxylase [Myxococcales bacterium]|nr:1-(5-phosphoribosyl)-5-amino-4-imidazole-carboxylate carboxylase [Myxococcales bacterium]
MDRNNLRALLTELSTGQRDINSTLSLLEKLPYEDIGFARIDHHRQIRTGMPEVVFGEGKTSEQVAQIVELMAQRGSNVLVTRLASEPAEEVLSLLTRRKAEGVELPDWTYDAVARTLALRARPFEDMGRGEVIVACAGTSDLPVAREAANTAEMMNNRVALIADIGVAGLHRLLDQRDRLMEAEVIIAVAGMEGALPGVMAGLVDRPGIGGPGSVGYGANFGGLSALLTMLNSCAPGLSVVNIDNGYGAAAAAAQINRAR